MDFGDIILGIVDVGILVGIFVSKNKWLQGGSKETAFVRRILAGNWDNSIVGCALSAICYLHME